MSAVNIGAQNGSPEFLFSIGLMLLLFVMAISILNSDKFFNRKFWFFLFGIVLLLYALKPSLFKKSGKEIQSIEKVQSITADSINSAE